MVRTKRVYEPPSRGDGRRLLVERRWPRGLTKARAALAAWLRDVAPSPDLHVWYGHDPARWAEFARRYRRELEAPDRRRLVDAIAEDARHGTVTLVYATRSMERNSAILLRDAVVRRLHRRAPGVRRARPRAARTRRSRV